MMHKVIGIDLGTTYSAVAAYDSDAMTSVILADENDKTTTPSVIGLDRNGKAIVGWLAKNNGPASPKDTIIEIKREMGELFDAASLDRFNARSRWKEKDPVHVLFRGEWMLPQEVSALTLMKMKAIAERRLSPEIRDAVITVPAYFTSNQKKATEDAALLAGLHPRQLIPEPTAAAICYGLDAMDPQERVYLVYDLGGGTFDVSIIRVKESDIQVVATSGDHRLGGGDFDDAIAYWALDEARKQGLDLTGNPLARALVKFRAEETKKLLAASMSAGLVVTDPDSKRSIGLTLDRATFESLIENLLRRSLTSVSQALLYAKEQGVKQEGIDSVLLVGGSTRIPKVRQILLDYFNKDERFVRADGNPDHLVARGAALVAHRFEPSPPPFDIKRRPSTSLVNPDAADVMNVTLITEHTLGVGVQEGRFDPLITRGTSIPVTAKKSYTNPEGAVSVVAPVFQGEGAYVQENTLIGELTLGPMQPLPAGQHRFEVTFSLDQNGLLSVIIDHQNEGKSYRGDFRHKTTVEGDDALITLRSRLLAMFEPFPGQAIVKEDVAPPPPPSPPPRPGSAVDGQVASPPPSPPSAPVPPDGAGMLPDGLLIDITAQLTDEHKGVLRRARKQLLRRMERNLVDAYNDFVRAANSGCPADELTDLGDDLEDAYQDARRAS